MLGEKNSHRKIKEAFTSYIAILIESELFSIITPQPNISKNTIGITILSKALLVNIFPIYAPSIRIQSSDILVSNFKSLTHI